MRTLTEPAKIYWEKREEEYGEKIHSRCMCKCFGLSARDQEAEWGILFFGDKHLYFQGFPSRKSWKAVLFRNTDPGEEKGSFVRMPLSELRFELAAENIRWWEKLLSKPERSLFVTHSRSHSRIAQYHFILFQPDAEMVAEIIRNRKGLWNHSGNTS